jgi:hypothetical protein
MIYCPAHLGVHGIPTFLMLATNILTIHTDPRLEWAKTGEYRLPVV